MRRIDGMMDGTFWNIEKSVCDKMTARFGYKIFSYSIIIDRIALDYTLYMLVEALCEEWFGGESCVAAAWMTSIIQPLPSCANGEATGCLLTAAPPPEQKD
jgi:hypothetical protein